jgi:hypothetical protein
MHLAGRQFIHFQDNPEVSFGTVNELKTFLVRAGFRGPSGSLPVVSRIDFEGWIQFQ